MADERRRRRRGHKRGRGKENGPETPPEETREETPEEPEGSEEEDASSEGGSRFSVPFLSRGKGDDENAGEEKDRPKEQQQAGGGPRVSPLGFWRRGSARAYREEPMPKQGLGRTMRRLRGMYFPPWVPVMFIVVVVFGILGALFFVRGATGAPHINEDHWHATYSVSICGQRQPHFPEWSAGVHTHADGIIHIHPFVPREEAAGARLVKWFEYGGGKLTQSEMRMPGDRDEYKNGDTCPDGKEAILQVFVNGEKLSDWGRYIPQDGDQVRIVFGPEDEGISEEEDRTIIPESEAARTEELEITGAEGDAAFTQTSLEIKTGETVKFDITNNGSISHSVRTAGADGEYETQDDYVSDPEIIEPGEKGVMVVRFDDPGEYEFQDPSAPLAVGTFVVTESGEAGNEETPEDQIEADVTLEVTMTDNAFEPMELEVEAGQTFRINLTNEGSFVHNMRVAGPDGVFETEDDILSTPDDPLAGEDGTLVGTLDKAGTYELRSDFQPTEMIGTITVK